MAFGLKSTLLQDSLNSVLSTSRLAIPSSQKGNRKREHEGIENANVSSCNTNHAYVSKSEVTVLNEITNEINFEDQS